MDTPNPNLPPDVGAYYTAAQFHALYSAGGLEILLSNIIHQPFAGSTIRIPSGPDELEQFDSSMTGDVAVSNGGVPIFSGPVAGNGPVQTIVRNKIGHVTGTFDTEMLSMSLTSVTPLGPVMIRESPTLPSLGTTSITDIGGGLYHIDSFFDVWTELSIDGGQTWIPDANGPAHVQLNIPAPGAATLLAFGTLAGVRRRRR